MTPAIVPGQLAALFDGVPKLILLPGLAAPEALALPGLALWIMEAGVLRPFGAAAETTGIALPAAPGEVLAIVAPDAAAAAPLRGWWREAAPADVPPVIEAASGGEALPQLAARAIAALAASAAEAVAAQQGLVALRQEHEALRLAQVAVRRAAAQIQPPSVPMLVASADPSAGGHAVAAGRSGLALSQTLGVRLEGLAAVALHLQEAFAGAEAVLRVRLFGAESGRIAGAWVLPGRALSPGWLTLDLPEPVGPIRETAWLEVKAELGPDDRLALSLTAPLVAPDGAVALAGGATETRALAHAVWTAMPGRRLVQSPFWDGEAIGLAAPPGGVPVELPQQIWHAARVPEGKVERVAIGSQPARLVASLGPGEQALVVLPAVPLNGLDLLQAELQLALGDAARLEAALWLQPEGTLIEAEADLSTTVPGARWSGWHGGGLGDGLCRLALALPPDAPRQAVVALVVRNLGSAPEQVLWVEIARLFGTRAVQPPPATEQQAAAPPALPQGPAVAAPVVAAVRLLECYSEAGGSYRHIDLLMEGVRAGRHAWLRLRCKLALNGTVPVLEFRLRPDWPVVFEHWPPTPEDAFGPYLQLTEAMLTGGFAATLATDRDRATLAAVLRLLPTVAATAARAATADPDEYERWIDCARRLAATLDAVDPPAPRPAPGAAPEPGPAALEAALPAAG